MNKMKDRIEAARKRLGDLKAVHTKWYNGQITGDEAAAEMESIAYSAMMYLDGVPGPYLADATKKKSVRVDPHSSERLAEHVTGMTRDQINDSAKAVSD